MRKWLAAILVCPIFLLSACGQGVGPGGTQYGVEDVHLKDGRTVECVMQDGGGVDCDWDHTR